MPSLFIGSSMLNSTEYSRHIEHFRSSISPPKGITNGLHFLDFKSSSDLDVLVKLAKDPAGVGNRELQQRMDQDEQFREKVLVTILTGGKDRFLQLCIDCNGCFVIQKLVENGSCDTCERLFDLVRPLAFRMVLNRFACRIVQKIIVNLAPINVQNLLTNQFKGHENTLVTDQNGNHFVQCVVEKFGPRVYGAFILALAKCSTRLSVVFENKYGCRVIQFVLERVVQIVHGNTGANGVEKEKATEILHVLIKPILKNAFSLAQNEFANYLVQFVIKSPFLRRQRCYIIKNHIICHVYHLSMLKYSSHVVEQAFKHAEDRCNCLGMLFRDVLEGYKTYNDGKQRSALYEMLFNQYGNYVVQRMIPIARDVCHGRRPGDPKWLSLIEQCVKTNIEALSRYSSGKKIINSLCPSVNSHYPAAVNTLFPY